MYVGPRFTGMLGRKWFYPVNWCTRYIGVQLYHDQLFLGTIPEIHYRTYGRRWRIGYGDGTSHFNLCCSNINTVTVRVLCGWWSVL